MSAPNNDSHAGNGMPPAPGSAPYNPYSQPQYGNQPLSSGPWAQQPQWAQQTPYAQAAPMRKPWYAQWWVWLICLLAVAAIAVGITLAVTSSQPAKVTIQPADLPENHTPNTDSSAGATDKADPGDDSDTSATQLPEPDTSMDDGTAESDTTSLSPDDYWAKVDTLKEIAASCTFTDAQIGSVRSLKCEAIGTALTVQVIPNDAASGTKINGRNRAQTMSANIWNTIHKESGLEGFSVSVEEYDADGSLLSVGMTSSSSGTK